LDGEIHAAHGNWRFSVGDDFVGGYLFDRTNMCRWVSGVLRHLAKRLQ